jgi:predicted RNase H-like HicB family nuclease
MAEPMMKYVARAERDESGWWVGTVPALRGVVTQARTLRRLRANLVDAVALWLEVEQVDTGKRQPHVDRTTIEIELETVLPAALDRAATAARRQRARAADAEAQAAEATQAAVALLVEAGLSQRDAAEILGLSHQRVAQLAS